MKVSRIVGAVSLVGVLALSACTTGAPKTPATGSSSGSAASVSSTPQADGIELQTITDNDPKRPVFIQWPHLAGQPKLNKALDEQTQKAYSQFTRDFVPADNAPELNISSDVAINTTSLAAVTLHTSLFAGGSTGSKKDTTWAVDGAVKESVDLIAKSKRDELVKRLNEAAAQAGAPVFDQGGATDPSIPLSSFLPTAQAWRFTIPSGTLTPESSGELTLELPRDVVAPFLSTIGTDVLKKYDAANPAPTSSAPPPAPQTPAPAPPPAPQPPAPVDCNAVACVALTFDDGPGKYTNALLDTLAAKKAPATFFLLGKNISSYPDAVKRQQAMGMQQCSHSFNHPNLKKLSAEQQKNQFDQTQQQYAAVIPGGVLNCVRPPYGNFDANTRALGLPIINWDIDTEDWKNKSTEVTTQRALDGAKGGSIILVHDIHATSVKAVPAIIDGLRAKGLTLVTVAQLLPNAQPGTVYFSQHQSN